MINKKDPNRKRSTLSIYMVLMAVLALVYLSSLFFIHKHMLYMLDSDMSSEMILSKVLSQEKRIITDSWYYSTEIRFLNTQLIQSFFFLFLKSWHTVRLLSTAVLHLILVVSVFSLCKRLRLKFYAPAVATTLLLSMSASYFFYVLMGCYYIPHISISFFAVSLCLGFAQEQGKKKTILLFLSLLLALLSSVGGLRQIVIIYVPLCLCIMLLATVKIYKDGWDVACHSKIFRCCLISIANIAFCIIGYLINVKVFASWFHFMVWQDMKYVSFDPVRLKDIFNDFLVSFGYFQGSLNLRSTFSNAVCAILVILTIYSVVYGISYMGKVSAEYTILASFYLCNLAIFVIMYTMTDMMYRQRYIYPISVFAFPLIAVALYETDFGKAPRHTKTVFGVLCFSTVILRSVFMLSDLSTVDKTRDLRQVCEYLSEAGYTNGYASFWNANILTELSDGEIDVWAWPAPSLEGVNTSSVNDITKWLQKTEHFAHLPKGKVFLLYADAEVKHYARNEYLPDSAILYHTDAYTIYGFEDYDAMMGQFGEDQAISMRSYSSD